MKASQLRERIIKPTLHHLDSDIPYSKEAEDLLVATACAESQCGYYIDQVGGPARSIFQIEPETEQDNIDSFLVYHEDLYVTFQSFQHVLDAIYNPYYATFMARVKYFRDSAAIPKREDGDTVDDYLSALGGYWKRVYNTGHGAGTVEGFVGKCQAFGDFYV